ncbi:MAG: bifunctional UDP-sugar hydrolase/5'-nucleotidase, partial [Planctomycetota bacterium]
MVVIHTNDLHGQVLPRKNGLGEVVGGFSAIAARVRRERAEAERAGDGFLLLDAGDFFQGTPEGDLTHGVLPLEVMNSLRYDAIEVGNHEFDQGQENLRALAAKSASPFLCANLYEEATGKRPEYVRPFVVVEARGVRIGIVGLLTSGLKQVCLEKNTVGLVVRTEAEALVAAAAEARAAGAEVVVALTHCGYDVEQVLAAKVPDVPVIFGGHSHTSLPEGWREPSTGVLVCQNGGGGLSLTRAVLEFDSATHELLGAWAGHVIARDADGRDAEADAIQARYAPEIEKVMSEPVCEVSAAFTREGEGSSTLGNLVCDAMREAAGADIALHNRTGIRADLPAGTARLREMYQLSPFGNTIVTMELTGAEVLELVDGMFQEPRMFLETSGLAVDFDRMAPAGKRVVSASVGGEPIRADRAYKVATNNFLARGGDGHEVFTRGRNVRD